MKGALVFIGDELLSGDVPNINAEVAIGELTGNGFEIKEVLVIPDEINPICEHLRRIKESYNFFICSGGLGPTDDDLTNEAVAFAFGLELKENKKLAQAIACSPVLSRIKELSKKMALLPKGAKLLSKDLTCAGYYLEIEDKLCFFLPGVPSQFRRLLKEEVIPLLQQRFKATFRKDNILTFKFFDLNEVELNKFLKETDFKAKFGYYPEFPELRLVAKVEEEKEAEKISSAIKQKFLWEYIGEKSLPLVLHGLLTKNKMTLSVAESCTGGLISSLITSVPGSSEYFERGLVTYSVRSKIELLGVKDETVKKYGVVSYETAIEMAEGIKRATNTDIGLGITGIAGPTGGTPYLPVGTVFIAISFKDFTKAIRFEFPGSRKEVQLLAAYTAIDMVRRYFCYGSESLSGYRFAKGFKEKTS